MKAGALLCKREVALGIQPQMPGLVGVAPTGCLAPASTADGGGNGHTRAWSEARWLRRWPLICEKQISMIAWCPLKYSGLASYGDWAGWRTGLNPIGWEAACCLCPGMPTEAAVV